MQKATCFGLVLCALMQDRKKHNTCLQPQVGYGTTDDGVDYWLLRNSWSVMWGESGYFKITRKGNDCGVTMDGVVAIVEDDAVARGERVLLEGALRVAYIHLLHCPSFL